MPRRSKLYEYVLKKHLETAEIAINLSATYKDIPSLASETKNYWKTINSNAKRNQICIKKLLADEKERKNLKKSRKILISLKKTEDIIDKAKMIMNDSSTNDELKQFWSNILNETEEKNLFLQGKLYLLREKEDEQKLRKILLKLLANKEAIKKAEIQKNNPLATNYMRTLWGDYCNCLIDTRMRIKSVLYKYRNNTIFKICQVLKNDENVIPKPDIVEKRLNSLTQQIKMLETIIRDTDRNRNDFYQSTKARNTWKNIHVKVKEEKSTLEGVLYEYKKYIETKYPMLEIKEKE